MPQTVVQASTLPAAAEAVWARAVTPEGINDELRPLLRMTMPSSLRGKTISEVPLGEQGKRGKQRTDLSVNGIPSRARAARGARARNGGF